LTVLYSHMTSLGGDAFWLTYDARSGAVRYLDGGGRAAASASIDWFTSCGYAEVPFRGVLPATLTTPCAVASWAEAHVAYARLPLARCLASAITYARNGFPVTERLAGWIERSQTDLSTQAEATAIFMPGGQVPRSGSQLTNPDLAQTLKRVAADGPPASIRDRSALNWRASRKRKGGFQGSRPGCPVREVRRATARHLP